MTLPCRTVDPETFFTPALQATAKALCAGCGIRESCAEGARARGEEAGVWGGEVFAPPAFVRPTVRGLADHGTRARYQTCTAGDGGKACRDCRAANTAYAARHRNRPAVTPIEKLQLELTWEVS